MKKQISIVFQVDGVSYKDINSFVDFLVSSIKGRYKNSKVNIYIKEYKLNDMKEDGYLKVKKLTGEKNEKI